MDIKIVTKGIEPHNRIYLCGPMTGLPNYNIRNFYSRAEAFYKKGYKRVFNPAEMSERFGLTLPHEFYMREGLKLLLMSDVLYAFGDCSGSKGAALEQKVAKECGIRIVYETMEACLYV